MALPLLPLLGIAAAALALGGGSKGGAPEVSQGAKALIGTSKDPQALYEEAGKAFAAGREGDAIALLAAANYFRSKQGQPELGYPPTSPYPPSKTLALDIKPAPPVFVFSPGSLSVIKPSAPPFVPGSIGLSQPQGEVLGEAKGAAIAALKEKANQYIKSSASLGKLDSTVAMSSLRIITALLEGGQEAVGEALSVALAGIATGLCAGTPAAPLSPLCGAVGAWAGKTMVTGLGATSTSVEEMKATRGARFAEVYNPLISQIPDDRGTVSIFNSIYRKANAQLLVLCALWVDCITFAAIGAYGQELPFGAKQIAENSAGASVVDKGLDDVDFSSRGGLPHGYTAEQWSAQCGALQEAFSNLGEPLVEFQAGAFPSKDGKDPVSKAREQYWRFSNRFRYGKLDPTITPAFRLAASRIILAAKTAAETRFAVNVLNLAGKLESVVLPECKGKKSEKVCAESMKRVARRVAYDSLANARGLPAVFGTPQSIIADGLQELRAEAHKYA